MIFKRVNPNVLSNVLEARHCKHYKRRGVLLLVTVCMLTLFLMLGTAYLVAASRARESANAIARKALFADQTNYRPETYLDNVIMQDRARWWCGLRTNRGQEWQRCLGFWRRQ